MHACHSRRPARVEQFTVGYYKTDRSLGTDNLGNIWKHSCSGPRNCSALRLLIIVRYTNTLTYLLTYTLQRSAFSLHKTLIKTATKLETRLWSTRLYSRFTWLTVFEKAERLDVIAVCKPNAEFVDQNLKVARRLGTRSPLERSDVHGGTRAIRRPCITTTPDQCWDQLDENPIN